MKKNLRFQIASKSAFLKNVILKIKLQLRFQIVIFKQHVLKPQIQTVYETIVFDDDDGDKYLKCRVNNIQIGIYLAKVMLTKLRADMLYN